MFNVLLIFINIIVTFSIVILIEKIFKKEGLYVWAAIALIAANILECQTVGLFNGFTSKSISNSFTLKLLVVFVSNLFNLYFMFITLLFLLILDQLNDSSQQHILLGKMSQLVQQNLEQS